MSKVTKAEVDELAEKMEETLNLNIRKAIITIGRWQPPHQGHAVLINAVLEEKAEYEKRGIKDVGGFVYIPARPDESRPELKNDKDFANIMAKNPLKQLQKWYYLNLMYSDPNLKFLVTRFPSHLSHELLEDLTREDLDWSGYAKSIGYSNEILGTDMESTKKRILQRKQRVLKKNYERWKQRTPRITATHSHRAPSIMCLNYLKRHGYGSVDILVGSDRVDSFTQYNKPMLTSSFTNSSVKTAKGSKPRPGGLGNQQLDAPVPVKRGFSLGDKDEQTKAAELINQCSIADGEHSCSGIDGKFSGTILRHCVEDLKCGEGRTLNYFVEGVKIGTRMENIDCLSLLNDIGKELGYQYVSIDAWNSKVNEKYKIINTTPLFTNKSDEQHTRVKLAQLGYFGQGGKSRKRRRQKKKTRKKKKTRRRKGKRRKRRKKKTRKKRGNGGVFSRKRKNISSREPKDEYINLALTQLIENQEWQNAGVVKKNHMMRHLALKLEDDAKKGGKRKRKKKTRKN